MILPDKCLVCGRRYRGQSKPTFCLDPRGRVRGTAHASCHDHRGKMEARGLVAYCGNYATTEREAELNFYLHYYRYRKPLDMDTVAGVATYLAMSPNDEDRLRIIEHWKNGPMQITDEYLSRVQAVYETLDANFELWRARR